MKVKQNAGAGWMTKTTVTIGEWRLILGAMAGSLGLLHALRDDVHCLHVLSSGNRIPGDHWDGRHAKIHQYYGNVPHQDRQPPGLGEPIHLGVL
jgi:hypothetical protein